MLLWDLKLSNVGLRNFKTYCHGQDCILSFIICVLSEINPLARIHLTFFTVHLLGKSLLMGAPTTRPFQISFSILRTVLQLPTCQFGRDNPADKKQFLSQINGNNGIRSGSLSHLFADNYRQQPPQPPQPPQPQQQEMFVGRIRFGSFFWCASRGFKVETTAVLEVSNIILRSARRRRSPPRAGPIANSKSAPLASSRLAPFEIPQRSRGAVGSDGNSHQNRVVAKDSRELQHIEDL